MTQLMSVTPLGETGPSGPSGPRCLGGRGLPSDRLPVGGLDALEVLRGRQVIHFHVALEDHLGDTEHSDVKVREPSTMGC